MQGKMNKPCNFFQNGNCNKGDNCNFLHIIKGGNNPQSESMGNKPKTRQCGFFLSGTCRKGDNCDYLHGNPNNEMVVNNNNEFGNGNNFNNNNNNNNIQNNKPKKIGGGGGICRKFLEGICLNKTGCK